MFAAGAKRLHALLGLSLEGRHLDAVVLQRANGSLRVAQTLRTTLTLDPLTNDPELVGQEIRNLLDRAQIRERRCALCLPLPWALTLQTNVPDLPEADVPGFLQLEAERGFPYALDDLALATSRYRIPQGEHLATLVAIPKNHLNAIDKALRAAKLSPVSFSLGITALLDESKETGAGCLTLVLGKSQVDLAVSFGASLLALRSLPAPVLSGDHGAPLDASPFAREIRITLGQLPKELQGKILRIRVFAAADLVHQVVEWLTPAARGMGLRVEPGYVPGVNGSDPTETKPENTAAAAGLAARLLTHRGVEFEYLPPRQTFWTQAVARYSSAKILYASAAAGAVVLLLAGSFLWQQWRLSRLDAQWRALRPRVTEIEAIQQQMRRYRPWFDESVRSLRILQRLTEAFPEDGAVTAKTFEIRNVQEVSCAGQARDNQALLRMMDQLRESRLVSDLKIVQMSGKSPLQFNLNFRWQEGGQP